MTLLLSPKLYAGPDDFRAPWWCRGAHMQTIYGGLFRENPDIQYRRERFDLPDGDFLDLDWLDGEKGKPAVVIFHGLASASSSPYIKVLVDELRKKGWTAVVMCARGQSGEPNRTKETNHAGRSQDVGFAVNHVLEVLRSKNPEGEPELYAVGYSLGGNMLVKWLGSNPVFIPSQLKRAVSVSAAYDLEKTASNLDKDWFNREVYVRSMLNYLKPLALAKEAVFPGSLNTEAVKAANTFKAYDREVTARLNGFKDEGDYWTRSSSKNYMDGVSIPMLMIHAVNDPFLPGDDLPYEQMLQSQNIKLLLTEDGGHLGFVSGKWPCPDFSILFKKYFYGMSGLSQLFMDLFKGSWVWKPERWLEHKILRFLSEK